MRFWASIIILLAVSVTAMASQTEPDLGTSGAAESDSDIGSDSGADLGTLDAPVGGAAQKQLCQLEDTIKLVTQAYSPSITKAACASSSVCCGLCIQGAISGCKGGVCESKDRVACHIREDAKTLLIERAIGQTSSSFDLDETTSSSLAWTDDDSLSNGTPPLMQSSAFVGYDCDTDCDADASFRHRCLLNPSKWCTSINPVRRAACLARKAIVCDGLRKALKSLALVISRDRKIQRQAAGWNSDNCKTLGAAFISTVAVLKSGPICTALAAATSGMGGAACGAFIVSSSALLANIVCTQLCHDHHLQDCK